MMFEKTIAWNVHILERLSNHMGEDLTRRIRLLSMNSYPEVLRYADIALDTFPYGGILF